MPRAPPCTVIDVQVDHPDGVRFGARVRAHARTFVEELELRDVELSVTLTTDDGIRALNRAWRHKDRPTDVLSFPGGSPLPGARGPLHLGDVVISLDTARRQAGAVGRTVAGELDRYLAHGLLHLLGHDHHTPADARRMAALEERLLGASGMLASRVHPHRR